MKVQPTPPRPHHRQRRHDRPRRPPRLRKPRFR
ncbi:MAG: hypothetical protein ACJAQT_001768 [Akkermansiaceae bacterium]|jgi:hypothetical protein